MKNVVCPLLFYGHDCKDAGGRVKQESRAEEVQVSRLHGYRRATQVGDYANMKGESVQEMERWLAPNLGYDV